AQAANWGVDQYSTSTTVLRQLERLMGHRFQAWSVCEGLDAPGAYSRTGGPALRSGKTVFLNITSTYSTQSGRKRPYCWDNIAAGRNDNQLAAWANAIREAGHQGQLIIT